MAYFWEFWGNIKCSMCTPETIDVLFALCVYNCLVELVVDWIQVLGCLLVTSLPWHFMPCTQCSSHSRCGYCIDRPIVPPVCFSVLVT